MKTDHSTIDEYIAEFPEAVQAILEQVRATIKAAAPGATEAIKYGIPTFVLEGNLVHFAAYKNHLGFYPAPLALDVFKEELAEYRAGKGTAQFPLDKELPLDLIARMTKFRVQQNLEKAAEKKKP